MRKKDRRELVFSVTIHDCRVDTFRCGGHGGQNLQKTDSGVRVVHEPSGAVGESREERSQAQNKKRAFRRMAETKRFQDWVRMHAASLAGVPSVETVVRAQLAPANLRIEARDARGKWEERQDLLPDGLDIDNLMGEEP